MKPPEPEATPRIDVSCEELEALLEGVRAALGEAGYQKLQAAIRTLGYVTELLENQEATLDSLRRLLCHSSTEKTEKGAEAGRHRDGREEAQAAGRAHPEEYGCRAWAQWRRRVSRGAQGRRAARDR